MTTDLIEVNSEDLQPGDHVLGVGVVERVFVPDSEVRVSVVLENDDCERAWPWRHAWSVRRQTAPTFEPGDVVRYTGEAAAGAEGVLVRESPTLWWDVLVTKAGKHTVAKGREQPWETAQIELVTA